MFTTTGRYLLVSQSVPWIVLLGTARREHRGPRMRPLFDMGYSAPTSRLLNTLSAHRIREELVDRNTFVKAAYFADDRPPLRWIEERNPNQWSDGVSLAAVLLMSLGLWAAAWEVIASLASAWLR